MHKHQRYGASTSTTDGRKSRHEIRECGAPRQTRADTQEDCNMVMEELPPEEDASTIHTTQIPKIERERYRTLIEHTGPTYMKWSPRKSRWHQEMGKCNRKREHGS